MSKTIFGAKLLALSVLWVACAVSVQAKDERGDKPCVDMYRVELALKPGGEKLWIYPTDASPAMKVPFTWTITEGEFQMQVALRRNSEGDLGIEYTQVRKPVNSAVARTTKLSTVSKFGNEKGDSASDLEHAQRRGKHIEITGDSETGDLWTLTLIPACGLSA